MTERHLASGVNFSAAEERPALGCFAVKLYSKVCPHDNQCLRDAHFMHAPS